MVLVHGGRDHGRSWDWVAQELRRDFHIIAPDLHGHGNSAWSDNGCYTNASFVFDLAQLIEFLQLAPVVIIGHSLGGSISLRYAGLYPAKVRKLVAIEGLGHKTPAQVRRESKPLAERWHHWIAERQRLCEQPERHFPTFDGALGRMRTANRNLSPEQARHLTLHGLRQRRDGTYSWKFDPYFRALAPVDLSVNELRGLWTAIECPTMLAWGRNSWASNPAQDGNLQHFRDARLAVFERAGHWLHHDRFDAFIDAVRRFLAQNDDMNRIESY